MSVNNQIRTLLETGLSIETITKQFLGEAELTADEAELFQDIIDMLRVKIQNDYKVSAVLIHRNIDDGDVVDYHSSILVDIDTPSGAVATITMKFIADGQTGEMSMDKFTVKLNGTVKDIQIPTQTFPVKDGQLNSLYAVVKKIYDEQMEALQHA